MRKLCSQVATVASLYGSNHICHVSIGTKPSHNALCVHAYIAAYIYTILTSLQLYRGPERNVTSNYQEQILTN